MPTQAQPNANRLKVLPDLQARRPLSPRRTPPSPTNRLAHPHPLDNTASCPQIGFVPQSASAAGETPDKSHENLAVLYAFQLRMNRPAASQKGGKIRPRYIIG